MLVIPKGAYASFDDFSRDASAAEITAFIRATGQIARDLGVAESGYRVLVNTGADALQEVDHFHMHIFAGQPLGHMIKPPHK